MANTLSDNEKNRLIDEINPMIQDDNLDGIKSRLNTLDPAIQSEIINYGNEVETGNNDDKRNGESLFTYSIDYEKISIISFFIEKGADVNYLYYSSFYNEESTPLLDAIRKENLQIVKLLVDNGATLTTPPSLRNTFLHETSKIDILKYLLEKGVDVHEKNYEGNTALNYHTEMLETSVDFLKELLNAGSDPNTFNAYGVTPLDKLVLGDQGEGNVEKIKLLIKYDANITSGIQDAIDDGSLAPEIVAALNPTNIKPPKPWKGWTQSDAKALDEVFNNPSNFSACPVCLKYSSREDGCMYMNHTCTELGGLYNKNLYRMYKNDEGKIYWCTLCNRICLGHRHYKLSLPETKAILGEGGDPFATDCRPNGGGYPEKVQRFRRLREYALELNDAEIDEQTAFNELTEEFWKAPLRREKKVINNLVAKKVWSNTNKFPANRAPNNANNANAPNIPSPPGLVMPTLSERGYNSIGMNDDVPVLHFHHETTGGIDHNDSLIGVTTLKNTLVQKLKNFGTEEFGFCIQYPECKARLFPEEIKPYVPDELYKDYKKRFNAKFKNRSGGANVNFFGEATDAKCLIKKGGRRRKTMKRVYKKSRKSRRRF